MTKHETDLLKDYPAVLSPQDLRRILRIGRAATYRLLADGTIPSFKIGRVYKIPKTALASYLNLNRQGGLHHDR